MHQKEAHTAEHIFVGSLQRLVSNIFVRKVEHRDSLNKIYIKCQELSLDSIHEAELMANKIIEEGRRVKEHNFQSLEEARKMFPQMRAYEERISGSVRVIEIDGYDYAACAREHTQSTSECGLFIITRVSREQDEHEIEFVVGEAAKLSAIDMSMRCIKVARELGASMNTLEATAKNLREDLDGYKKKLVQITEQLVDNVTPKNSDGKLVYAKVFDMLDDSTIMKKAGEIIKQPNTLVAFANIGDSGIIVLACNDKLQINCDSILKSALSRFGGKGGGKLNFATGSVPKDKVHDIFDTLLKDLHDQILNHL